MRVRALCEWRKAEKRSSHKRKGDTTMPPAAKHKSSETNNWCRLFRKHTWRVFSRDITLTRTALISYLARKEEKGATVAECSHCVHPLTIIVQRGRCLICPALFSLLIVLRCPLASSPSASRSRRGAGSYLVMSPLSLARPLISAVGEALCFTMEAHGMDRGQPAEPQRHLYNFL